MARFLPYPKKMTIDSWTGTGYIVYDPVTDTSVYMLNTNLNGGSICSWIGFLYLCEIVMTTVECVWAFNGLMLGATILGAGLLMTGGAAILTVAVGVGAIFAGYAWVANIGESFCESTELMIDYINGDEKAGEKLELKAAVHIIADVTIAHFGMKASQEFAKIHLDQKVGSFFAKAFERTSIGCDGALEILNRISPKYADILNDLINYSGSDAAYFLSSDYEIGGVKEVEKTFEVFEASSGKLTYNGDGTWTSSEGLVYGKTKYGNRVLHVLEHTKPNPNKRTHTVFNVEKKDVIGLIDEAWKNRGSGVLQDNGTLLYEIEMGKVIGTNGEDTIIIVTKNKTNEIVTSYPKAK